MNLAPFVVHTWSSGGAAMSKAVSIVRNADYAATRVKERTLEDLRIFTGLCVILLPGCTAQLYLVL